MWRLKLPSRKLEPWFILWSPLLLRLLRTSINLPCGHACKTVVMSGLVVLVTTCNCWISYKQIYMTAGPSLAISLEPIAHRQNVTSINLFYRYYFGRCSSKWAKLVPLPYFRGRSTCYFDRLHDFSVTIPWC